MSYDGSLPFFNDAVAGTVRQIAGHQAQLFGLRLLNTTAAAAYLQVFALPAASVTLGTTVADYCIRLAANEGLWIPFVVPVMPSGGTGLSVAGTTTATGSTGAAISVAAFYG